MNKLYLLIVLMVFTVFFLGASSKEKEVDIGCQHRQMLQVHRTEEEGFFWCVECNHYVGQWTKK